LEAPISDFDFDFDLGVDLGDFDVPDIDGAFDADVADIDGNAIPDVHETMFIRSGDSPVPDLISAEVDLDGDGLADHLDDDLDGDGVADGADGPDMDGDGVGDFADPFVDTDGNLISDHADVRHILTIRLYNPFHT
jgi:hypothetical protein